MSAGQPYYPSAGMGPYQYYQTGLVPQTYDYNHQTVSVPPIEASSGASKSASTPPPPGLDNAEKLETQPESAQSLNSYDAGVTDYAASFAGSVYPGSVATASYATPMAYLHPYGYAYPTASAMDAAQRWNAMNCSYLTGETAPEIQVQPSFNAVSGPRFPLRGPQKSNLPSYSVYSCPNSGSAIPQTNTGPSKLSDSAGGESQWSPELKDYVQRAFCSTENSLEKDQMERILREKLEYIFRNKITIDWAREPIPTVPSKSLAAIRAANHATSVSVLRPVSMQSRLGVRGRLGGPLPTGTLRPSASGRKFPLRQHESENSETHIFSPPQPGDKSPPSRGLSSRLSPRPHYGKRRACRSRSRSHSLSYSSSSSDQTSNSSRRHTYTRGKHRRRSPTPKRHLDKKPYEHHYYDASDGNSEYSSHSRDSSIDHDITVDRRRSPTRQNATRGKKRGGRGNNSFSEATERNNNAGHDYSGQTGHGKRGGNTRGRGKRGRQWCLPEDNMSRLRLSQRANRFKDHLVTDSSLTGAGSIAKSTSQLCLLSAGERDDQAVDFYQFKIIGTMDELEKPYLRLTSAPEPSNVRPVSVLTRALVHVKRRWKEKGDYHWVCEQFKSIRQDLLIQGVETELTAEVYEAHADVALEVGDFEEFHQCQSQLLRLHSQNLGMDRRLEFSAYRLLYYLFTLDFLGISTLIASYKDSHKAHPCIQFALKVREAWVLQNYRRFFQLACPRVVLEDPRITGCVRVLAWSLARERKQAAKTIFKAYRPSLSLEYLVDVLGFQSTTECSEFLTKEVSLSSDSVADVEKLDCKEIWSQICNIGA